jgi:hypothetical protein
VTELLGGFAGMVRDRALRKIEPQTGLLALLVFVLVCVTWIDAWNVLRNVTLDIAGLWKPILIGTFYYLAASVVFPSDPADYDRLGEYFADRKRFVVAMLLGAEILVTTLFFEDFANLVRVRPAEFWLWIVPYNLTIKGCMIALLFVRSRRANIILLALIAILFLVPYWEHFIIRDVIGRAWGYPPAD